MIRASFAAGLLVSLLAAAGDACAQQERSGEDAHFYKGRDYGSESVYNPLTVILNRGFDMLQLRPKESPWDQQWRTDTGNVADNVIHPVRAINTIGWGTWLRTEIFPLTFGVEGARWAPNYSLHLIGGGQTFAMLREWYIAHDVPLPSLFSVSTLFTAAFINESLENHGVKGPNTDCLADLLVFDIAGVILFSSEWVKNFFEKEVILSDWSLQPTFNLKNGDLRNQGNYYSLKWPIPFVPQLRLFAYMGLSTQGGLSLKTERGYSVSVAAGGRVDRVFNTRNDESAYVVTAKPAVAVFVDKNDSLLVGLQINDVDYDYMRLNIYPNAFFHTDPGIGFFASATRDRHFMAGLSFTRTLGVGAAYGRQ